MGGLLVGVVTPVYNRRQTLTACVRSVAAQHHPHVHVLADDGSTDGSAELARWLARRYRGLIVLDRTRGSRDRYTSANAMNLGLAHALREGVELVTRLDSDDVLAPHSLARRAACFDDATGAVYARQGSFTADAVRPGTGKLAGVEPVTKAMVFSHRFPFHSVMVRRRCLEAMPTRYRGELDYHEDLDFMLSLWQTMARLGLRWRFCDCLAVHTRGHADSISGRITFRRAMRRTLEVWWAHRDGVGLRPPVAMVRQFLLPYRLWYPFRERRRGAAPAGEAVWAVPGELRWFEREPGPAR
jgi:glycosyltransferase involved in cell wall biosynthesis